MILPLRNAESAAVDGTHTTLIHSQKFFTTGVSINSSGPFVLVSHRPEHTNNRSVGANSQYLAKWLAVVEAASVR